MRMVNPRVGIWRTHRALLLLVGVICVIFLLQVILGESFYGSFMVVPREVAEAGRQFQEGQASSRGVSEVFTLISYAFLHGDAEHILMNMVFLWMFGALVVELLGARWMLFLFAATAVGGALFHIMLDPGSRIPMLGASGSVMGFEGAYLALAVRWRLPNPHVWPISRPIPPTKLVIFALVGLGFDYVGVMNQGAGGIAYGAHIGGFLSGLLLVGLLAKRPQVAQPR